MKNIISKASEPRYSGLWMGFKSYCLTPIGSKIIRSILVNCSGFKGEVALGKFLLNEKKIGKCNISTLVIPVFFKVNLEKRWKPLRNFSNVTFLKPRTLLGNVTL